MLMNRYGLTATAAVCAGALFAGGFALGSDDRRRAQADPKRAAPSGGSPTIVSLRDAGAIPPLRTSQSRGASAGADAAAGANSSGAGAAGSSDPAAPMGSQGASAGSAGSAGSSLGGSANTTKPMPAEPEPVRRRSTE
jgi:hypothetical protein